MFRPLKRASITLMRSNIPQALAPSPSVPMSEDQWFLENTTMTRNHSSALMITHGLDSPGPGCWRRPRARAGRRRDPSPQSQGAGMPLPLSSRSLCQASMTACFPKPGTTNQEPRTEVRSVRFAKTAPSSNQPRVLRSLGEGGSIPSFSSFCAKTALLPGDDRKMEGQLRSREAKDSNSYFSVFHQKRHHRQQPSPARLFSSFCQNQCFCRSPSFNNRQPLFINRQSLPQSASHHALRSASVVQFVSPKSGFQTVNYQLSTINSPVQFVSPKTTTLCSKLPALSPGFSLPRAELRLANPPSAPIIPALPVPVTAPLTGLNGARNESHK
jgi:hypothetical protein